MDEDNNDTENPWKFSLENQSIKLCDEYNSAEKQSGTFSFSNSLLNVSKRCKLVKSFCECVEVQLKEIGVQPRKIKTTVNRISIFKSSITEGDMLVPIFNLEFLIKLGKKLEYEFSKKFLMEFTSQNVSYHMFRYFWMIKEEIKEYDKIFGTEYEKYFSSFELYDKILHGDLDFMQDFYEFIQKIYVPKELGLSE